MRVLRCLIIGNFLDTYHYFRILKLVFDVYFFHCLLGNICLSVICVAIKWNFASESILSQIEFCLLKHFIPNKILSLKAFCPKQNLFFFSFFFSIVRILQSPVHFHLTRVYRGIKKKSVKK